MVAHFPSLIYQVKNLNLKEKMLVTNYCMVYSASASAFWASQEHLQIIVSAWVLIAPSSPKKTKTKTNKQTAIKQFFLTPKHWKNEQVPPCWQKGQINNNIYADFRIAYKHILIPSYVIRVI